MADPVNWAPSAYPRPVDDPMDANTLPTDEAFRGAGRVYVDAMNVIGSRPDGWWRDREGAVRRLASRLQPFAAHQGAEVVLVVDGRPVAGLPEGRSAAVVVRYAGRSGRDAADDRIVELLDGRNGDPPDARPAATVVVTADRELGRRAQRLGAHVVGPRHLLAALDRFPDAPGAAGDPSGPPSSPDHATPARRFESAEDLHR